MPNKRPSTPCTHLHIQLTIPKRKRPTLQVNSVQTPSRMFFLKDKRNIKKKVGNFTSERAARRRIRLERDLEPGNLTVPDISLMGCSTISLGFCAVATDAEILKGDFATLRTESSLDTHKDFAEFWVIFFDPMKIECEKRGTFWVLGR